MAFMLLIAGLAASYIVLSHLYEELSVRKFISLLLATYFALAALFGTLLAGLHLSWDYNYFTLIFLGAAVLGYISSKRSGTGFLHLNYSTPDLIYILGILAVTAYLVYPAYPDFYPIATSEDPPRHFELAYYIQQSRSPPAGIDHPWTTEHVGRYPYGMHLNLAILSSALGIPLVRFIFPFMGLVVSLTAMDLADFVRRGGRFAYIAPFFFATSPAINLALAYQGSWSSLFAGFMAVNFICVMGGYIKDNSPRSLLYLVLLESSMVVIYPSWALLCLLAFLFAMATEGRERRMSHGLGFLVLSAAVTAPFWTARLGELGASLTTAGNTRYILQDHRVPVLLSGIVGAGAAKRGGRPIVLLTAAVLALPLLTFIYSVAVSQVEAYYFYKTYFYLEYPVAVFAALGLREVYGYLGRYNLRPLFFASLAVLAAVQVTWYEDVRIRTPSLTQVDYDVGTWMEENLPLQAKLGLKMDISKNRGRPYWLVALSNRSFDWDKTDDVVVVQGLEGRPDAGYAIANYDILYREGDLTVMRRKDL